MGSSVRHADDRGWGEWLAISGYQIKCPACG